MTRGRSAGRGRRDPQPGRPPGTTYLRVRASGAGGRRGRIPAGGAARPVRCRAPRSSPTGRGRTATELAPGGEAVGYLGWRHDQDWYRLSTAGLAEGSVLSVDLDPVPEVAASLQLYGADAHKLTEARGRKRRAGRPAQRPHRPRRSVRLRGGARRRRVQRRRALQPPPARRSPQGRHGGGAQRRSGARPDDRRRNGGRLSRPRRRRLLPLQHRGDGAARCGDRSSRTGRRGGRDHPRGRHAACPRRQQPARTGADRRSADPRRSDLDPRGAAPRPHQLRRTRTASPSPRSPVPAVPDPPAKAQ